MQDDASTVLRNQEASQDLAGARSAYADPGVNHLGFVVSDGEALSQRLRAAGYRESFQAPEHPFRRRMYFFDDDGNEFEFVEYRSERAAERNDYTL